MHVETRYGQDVNFEAVGLSPVNVAMLYPNPDEHDTAITGLMFAQALSPQVQATFGKFNTLDLFHSLYPQTGRGVRRTERARPTRCSTSWSRLCGPIAAIRTTRSRC